MATQKNKKTSIQNIVGTEIQPTILEDTIKIGKDLDKTLVDNVVNASASSQLNMAELENFTTMSSSRDQMYSLIDMMMQDSSVSSIIRTYAEDVCEVADNGHIMWCESQDPNISKFINYLLNVLNVDKHIFSWTYSLLTYGDVYLRLFRESDYKDLFFKKNNQNKATSSKQSLQESLFNEDINVNIHEASDPYSLYLEAVPDPSTMFELTKFGQTYGFIETPNTVTTNNLFTNIVNNNTNKQAYNIYNYKLKSNDINIYQADDFVHACLEDNYTRFPEKISLFISDTDYDAENNAQTYSVRRGKSILYDSYKIWREKSLLESSVLLNRITKSSIIRLFQIEVGDMPKSKAQNTVYQIKNMIEQKAAINTNNGMQEYTNPGPVENSVYTTTHNSKGQINVSNIGGDVDVKNLADLDYWNNKYYSSYGIPKQYFGWTDDGAGFNGGSSLTILSSVYSKGVIRIKNALIQAVTDAINLILVNKGCQAYINNFVLKMKKPATQEEKDYRESLSNQINAISNLKGLFTDVEDKVKQLEILKCLLTPLNYGDTLTQIINEEIDDIEKQRQLDEEEKEKEAIADVQQKEPTTEKAPADMDLNLPPAQESLGSDESSQLLTENSALNIANDNLPTPEELNEKIDFTKNN